jgi:hypothetical protein
LLESEAMRSTELHGERRSWNHHLVRRVVRSGRIFLEVWIFRNVRDRFQNFVTDHFTAAAAKRKDGVAHQDHAGARLILMADFVDTRLLDQLPRSQSAIGLVKSCSVSWYHVSLVVFLPGQQQRAMLESNSAPADVMRSEYPQVGAPAPWIAAIAFLFLGNPQQVVQARPQPTPVLGHEYQI